jgi:hypothetical protein
VIKQFIEVRTRSHLDTINRQQVIACIDLHEGSRTERNNLRDSQPA